MDKVATFRKWESRPRSGAAMTGLLSLPLGPSRIGHLAFGILRGLLAANKP